MADLLKDILKDIPASEVDKLQPPKKRGRPKKVSTIAAEQAAAQKEFIENYESITDRRPEPQRLIRALSLPEEKQQQALEDAMTVRQLAFCKEYPFDFNATQAAIRAGYDEKHAQAISHNLMQYRGIKKLIEIYTETQSRKITKIDKDYIIQKVTEIVSTASRDSDKLRGLELLARHLGMFIERTEISGPDGEAIKFQEETEKKAQDVVSQLRSMAGRPTLKSITGGKK